MRRPGSGFPTSRRPVLTHYRPEGRGRYHLGATLEEARDNLAEALGLYSEDGDADVGEAPVIVPIDVAV